MRGPGPWEKCHQPHVGRVGHLERKGCFTKHLWGVHRVSGAHGERRRGHCLQEAHLHAQVSRTRCRGELDRPTPEAQVLGPELSVQ